VHNAASTHGYNICFHSESIEGQENKALPCFN
jgi:hypothetical protein